jgi:hypothetical protein
MNELINSISSIHECTDSKSAIDNFDYFMLSLFDNSATRLVIEVESSECNGPPEFEISLNHRVLFCQKVPAGIHRYDIELMCNLTNTLSLAMINKQPTDTVVVDNIIVQDKWLKLHKLEINDYNLVTDYNFFNNFFKYGTRDSEQAPMPGFWSNSQLTLNFDSPFAIWYNSCSKESGPHPLASRMAAESAISGIEEKVRKSLANLKC